MSQEKTSSLVVGMPQRFRERSSGSPSLLVMAGALVDLLINSEGLELSPSELSDHMTAETEHYLPVDWYGQETQGLLSSLYETLLEQVWPLMRERFDVSETVVISQATPLMLHLTFRTRAL